MKMNPYLTFDGKCREAFAFYAEVLGGKWTILLVRDLAEGRSRFCELERSLEGISPRTLSLRLRALEEQGIVARKKFVYLCTNALLLEPKIDQYKPSPYLTFSIHLDGNRERHDAAVCREGTFDKAVAAIKKARDKGFRVTANCTLYAGEDPADVANFFDFCMTLGVEGVMMSPGYSYQHAPRQDVFLGRRKSKELFREIFKIGKMEG